MKSSVALGLVIAVCAGTAGTAIWLSMPSDTLIVQGEVEATRVDVVPRVAGQIVELHVAEGQRVQAGETLVELDNPQLMAALAAAEAGVGVAEADRARISSTRPEAIAARQAEYEKAQADLALAQQNYDRLSVLTERATASQAQFENAQNALAAAQAAVAATEANLTLATNGASPEERAVADAQVQQAKSALDQRRADVNELTVFAPISGEVVSRVAEMGAMAAAGAPLLSIVDVDDPWFTFNLREDLLGGLEIGDTIHVDLPAVDAREVPVEVTSISALGTFANWRATRATGDFDLRTFEVRARPSEPVPGLRPGMSAVIAWPNENGQR